MVAAGLAAAAGVCTCVLWPVSSASGSLWSSFVCLCVIVCVSVCVCVCICVCLLACVGPTMAAAVAATSAVALVDVTASSAPGSAKLASPTATECLCAWWQPVWLWLPVGVSVSEVCDLGLSH